MDALFCATFVLSCQLPTLSLHSSSSTLPLNSSPSTLPHPLSLHSSPSTPPLPWSSVFNVSSAFPSWTPHHDHIWNVLSFVKQSFYDKSAWRNEHQEGDGEEGTGKVFDEAAFRQEAQQCVKESLQSINHPKDDGRSTRARAHAHTHTHKRTNTHTSCCSMSSILYRQSF